PAYSRSAASVRSGTITCSRSVVDQQLTPAAHRQTDVVGAVKLSITIRGAAPMTQLVHVGAHRIVPAGARTDVPNIAASSCSGSCVLHCGTNTPGVVVGGSSAVVPHVGTSAACAATAIPNSSGAIGWPSPGNASPASW